MTTYESNHYYRACEYAKVSGLSPLTVEQYCRAGKLRCKQIHGRWHVAGSEFLEYVVEPVVVAKSVKPRAKARRGSAVPDAELNRRKPQLAV